MQRHAPPRAEQQRDHARHCRGFKPDLTAAFAAWPTAVFLVNPAGIVRAAGCGAGGLQRWLPSPSVGLNFVPDVLHAAPGSPLAHALAAAATQEVQDARCEVDLRLVRAGESLDVLVRVVGLDHGSRRWRIATVEDATRTRTAERALAATMGEAFDSGSLDAPTGLLARRHLDYALPVELRRSHRYGLKLSLAVTALADADGAMVAADAEKTLARALAQAVRRTDTAYHLRAGHFHVVLTHTDAQGAALALQRLTGRLDALQLGVHMRTAAVEAPPRTESPDYVALAQTLLADVDARLT